jgi:hypothetical protein
MPEVSPIPPLILHPFSGHGAEDSLDGVRASMELEGLIASEADDTDINRRILSGRYQEIRMLIFLGKDLFRWLQQAVEHIQSGRDTDTRIVEQSFAALVVDDPPETVKHKLKAWGVTDRRAVFSRAIGLHSMFQEPPPASSLSTIFVQNYHRYADHAYICFQHLKPFLPLDPKRYSFEIYASEEFARLLSKQWESGL